MSAVSEKVQTPSLSSIVSLSTKKSRMSVSSITSSTSEVHPVSSMADPTVIANLLPNKGECEILYSSSGVMEIGSKCQIFDNTPTGENVTPASVT